MKATTLVMVMCGLLGAVSRLEAAQEDLAKGFAQPPDAANACFFIIVLLYVIASEAKQSQIAG
jgi:hypothetical protein